jgi:hypothetical protein
VQSPRGGAEICTAFAPQSLPPNILVQAFVLPYKPAIQSLLFGTGTRYTRGPVPDCLVLESCCKFRTPPNIQFSRTFQDAPMRSCRQNDPDPSFANFL